MQVEEDTMFDLMSFAQFCVALELQPLDYIMVAVSWDLEVRVVVFESVASSEKVYNWL